jgi:hypothetical protein
MKASGIVLFLSVLAAGCASLSEQPVASLCGSGSGESWARSSAPVNSSALAALADNNPNFPVGRLDHAVEEWFASPRGVYMLCRRDLSNCTGEWWQFSQEPGNPAISRQDAWVCVTGAGPNNSFKPTPLRGAA